MSVDWVDQYIPNFMPSWKLRRLLGNSVFTDVARQNEVMLNQSISILEENYTKEKTQREGPDEGRNCNDAQQAKARQGFLQAPQLGERYGIDSPSEPPETNSHANNLISNFWPPVP